MPAQTLWIAEHNDIDLKTVAATVIIPAMAGKFFLLTDAWMVFRTLTATSVNAVARLIGIGQPGAVVLGVSRTFDDVTGLDVAMHWTLDDGSNRYVANINATGISLDVTTAATGTAVRGDVRIEGILF